MILQPSEFRYLNYCDNDVLLVLRSARHIERLLNLSLGSREALERKLQVMSSLVAAVQLNSLHKVRKSI